MIQNVKHVELDISIPIVFYNTQILKMSLSCNQTDQRRFNEKLKERFFNKYKFSNHDNKFILLLWKGVWAYEYMDD